MDILSSVENGIAHLQFNRPDKKNAITAAMYQSLADGIAQARATASTRVILISGLPEIFTAGNDLEDFLRNPPQADNSPVFQFLYQISHCENPIVAAVAGAAVGVGSTLLLHCDVVLAADNAKFSFPFVSLGLCPEAASSLLLPQLVGARKASEWLMLGTSISAQEAQAAGFINHVLPAEKLLENARLICQKLTALPANSLRTTKRLLKEDALDAVEKKMAEEGLGFRAMLGSPEAKEAMNAFLQKRKPDFSAFN